MRISTLTASILAVAALAAGCTQPTWRAAPTAEPVGPRAPQTEAEQQELSFLIGMTPHHGQAVDMGLLCLDRARDQRLLRLCQEVVRVQSREIDQMTTWALDWYGTQLSTVQSALHAGDGASGSHGILRDEQMQTLARAAGREFDRRFVIAMTEHHTGAIESAEGLRDVSPHAEVRQLASDIISAQEAEVALMSRWRDEWRTN
jgi:uncharacterized protein (DUF305 family)